MASEFTDSPLVSVIIPTYNHAHFLGDAIQSALDQDYVNKEILVIDDGSTDNTREVVANYSGRVRYIYQTNRGLSAARNTGISKSNGVYIALLDADDKWTKPYLSTVIPVFASDENIGMVYCGWRYIDSEGNDLPRISSKTVPPNQFFYEFSFSNFLVPSGVSVRRSCFDECGNFDTNLRSCEDRDMWLRIASTYKVIGIPEILVYYRIHGDNMTSNLTRMELSRRAVIEKHFGKEDAPLESWTEIRRRAYGGLFFRTALDHLQSGNFKYGCTALQKAFSIYYELIENVETYYEISCAYQPTGVKGLATYLDLSESKKYLLDVIEWILNHPDTTSRLKKQKKLVYSYASFALGLLAYNQHDFQQARKSLIQSIKYQPKVIIQHPRILISLIKSFISPRLMNNLKNIRMQSRGKTL